MIMPMNSTANVHPEVLAVLEKLAAHHGTEPFGLLTLTDKQALVRYLA